MEWLDTQSTALVRTHLGPGGLGDAYSLAFIVAIVAPLLLAVAYLTLWERKLIGWIQIRLGPEPRRPAGACCSRSPTG